MRALFNSLWRHQFFTLSSGVVGAQVLSLALMPLLTRLYPVVSFGYFAIYLATSNLIGIFSTLRLEQTIPITADQSEADQLSSMTTLMALFAGGLAALAFAFPQVRGLLPAMNQEWRVWAMIALSAATIGWIQILTQRILHNGKLKFASVRHIFDKGSFLLIAVIMAKTQHFTVGLIYAQTVGNLLSVAVLLLGCAWLPKLDWRAMLHLSKKYSDFPRLNTASMALQLFTTQLPILFYSYYFPPESLGFLNLAQRLAEAPNTIVSSALATVYYRRLLTAAKYQYRRIFVRTVLWSSLVFILPSVLFSFYAQPIIQFVFGLKWHDSTPFFLALVPLTVARLSFMLQQCWLIVLRRLDIDLKISALVLVGQALGLCIGIVFFTTLLGPVAAAAALTTVIFIFSLYWLYRVICQTQELPNSLQPSASLAQP